MKLKYYTADTLRADLDGFEERYGMTSDAHWNLRRADRLPAGISRFDSHVWAALYEDWRRLREN